MRKLFSLILLGLLCTSAWGAITCKSITSSSGEVYEVTIANMYSYYNSGNGWATNASGGAITSDSYYSAKTGSNNTNYIDPETETSGTKGQATGITLKTADNRSARFYFTGAVKATAFIAITGSGRTATITIYKKSDDSEVASKTGESYGSSGAYEKLEITGLSASEQYYAKVTATNDLCLYAMKFFAPSCTSVVAPTGLSCIAHTKNSLTFGWTEATNASKYTATLYSDAECTDQVTQTTNIATTSVTFSTLSGSTTYYCKVQSNGDGSTYCSEGGVTDAASGTTDGKDYTVTAATNNVEWGSAASSAGSLDEDETATITATPESGYKFVSWEVSGTGSSLSSDTDNPTTLTMGTADATVTATFRALEHYTIKYYAGEYGSGSAIADGDKTEDLAFTLSSSTYTRDGYIQTGWALTDGGSKAYDLGESYEENEDLDLYPVWTALDEQVDVTGNTTWDWADVTNGDKVEVGTDLNGKDVLFSNISKYGYTTISGLANQQALIMNGQRAYNNANGSKHCQVNSLKFNTTVAGIVTVEYANTGGNAARTVNVNGTKGSESVTDNSTYKSESFFVTAGSVTIKGVQVSDDADKMLRIRKVVFSISVSATIGTTGWTTFSSIAPLDLSDMTADHTVAAYYAYDAEGTDVMIRTTTATVPAGEGLLLKGTAGDAVTISVAASGTAITGNKLVGCTTSTDLAKNAAHYVLVNNGGTAEFQSLKDNGATIPAGKAYLNLSDITLAPGALRIVEEENQATSIEALGATENAVKFIQDGKLFIMRNGVVYDAMGHAVR